MSAGLSLAPGVVLELAEANYLYGIGPLNLLVEKIGADPAEYRALEWVRIVGHEVGWQGLLGERDVTVRVSAIKRALRPTGWRPERY